MTRFGHSADTGFIRQSEYSLEWGLSDAKIPAAAIWSPGRGMSKWRTRRSSFESTLAPEESSFMVTHSRSVRFAGLTLAVTTPLLAATALPAFAAGGIADVGAVVTAGNVHVESTKGLSRVTVVLCNGSTVVVDGWSVDQKSGDVEVDGIVQAVFIHSGHNTTLDAQALLARLAGADAVKGESTGTIAFHAEAACDIPTGPGGGSDPGGDNDGRDGGIRDENGDGTTTSPATTTDPAPVSVTDPVLVIHSDPAPATTTDPVLVIHSDPAPATLRLPVGPGPAEIPVSVLAGSLAAGGELPRTGAGDMQSLMRLALCLVTGGVALRATSSRRSRSAFPS